MRSISSLQKVVVLGCRSRHHLLLHQRCLQVLWRMLHQGRGWLLKLLSGLCLDIFSAYFTWKAWFIRWLRFIDRDSRTHKLALRLRKSWILTLNCLLIARRRHSKVTRLRTLLLLLSLLEVHLAHVGLLRWNNHYFALLLVDQTRWVIQSRLFGAVTLNGDWLLGMRCGRTHLGWLSLNYWLRSLDWLLNDSLFYILLLRRLLLHTSEVF